MLRARSTMRARRFVSTPSNTPMPDSRNTGASASWIAWAMSTTWISSWWRILVQPAEPGCGDRVRSRTMQADVPWLSRTTSPRQSAAYSRFRPGYPPELIDWVASAGAGSRLAVDCATGNGQAASRSPRSSSGRRGRRKPPQIVSATRAARPICRGPRRTTAAWPRRSVSLVAAAQAAHWFDFGRFHAECRRVLVPGGVVAAWTYEKFRLDPAGGRAGRRLSTRRRRRILAARAPLRGAGLSHAAVSVARAAVPAFALETRWDLDQVMGYLASWSAVQRYKEAHADRDPLPELRCRNSNPPGGPWTGCTARRMAHTPAAGSGLIPYNSRPSAGPGRAGPAIQDGVTT